MKRETIVRVLLWAATLGLLAAIWAFSAQPGPESNELTQKAVMPVAELAASAQQDASAVEGWYHLLGTLLRKGAHLLEYTLLGLLLSLLAHRYGLRSIWLPLAAGAACAAMDEIHQFFVPGRTGLVTDVLLDSLGVLLGLWAAHIIGKIRRKNHVHDQ